MNELAFASIKTMREKLARKEISPEELLSYSLKRFERYNQTLGAALQVFSKDTLAEKSSTLSQEGPLAGIPGIVKDNICQKGQITSCASKILQNYIASYDATVIERLNKAGALSIGRANCDEFAMGSSTETSAFMKTHNPWDLDRVPGGSSGGSAVAVAAGLVPWSLGSETGGSVRQPAALCGIVGMKPTYGLVSRFGLVAYASSLDQISPFTRTVHDNALVLSALSGKDSRDSTTKNTKPVDYTKNLTGKIKPGLKIGIVENALNTDGFDPEVQAALQEAIQEFKRLGAEIVPVKLPLMDYAAAMYFVISRAEAASNLSRFDGIRYGFRAPDVSTLSEVYSRTRSEGFGYTVKQRILIGNYVLSAGYADAYYLSAKKVQALLRAEFEAAFKDVDVLFAPVSPTPAFKFNAFADNSLAMDLQDYFTAPSNLTGMPAIALPCGFTKTNLPIGFQLLGPDLSEELLYQVAHAYESNTPWHTMHPQHFRD